MPTKSSPTITLTPTQAERLFELYDNVAAADAHFQRCQSDNFRQHLQGVYKAQNIAGAFADLRQKLDALEAKKDE